eukprot:CAMPEP_0172553334 /NCGR_PEP_ID=MMETSP1067-20121228/50147_1 /TAXON_ID=265564 ORGANISM="Thalassiosira punctigera, Strain Tpunct2005C2" /NCGR_SAMPLE_ID=MMETSP1067 /ASSEMBLY_ACC=CAM_ASM_000444 /LENGTH=207 /DNA_ID=CAMNT_0013341503 /DNA_START=48 /DNA_END=671 /DNA_ORIENTATION=-
MNSPTTVENTTAPMPMRNPLLSASMPPQRNVHKRRHHRRARSGGDDDKQAPLLSASIPMPKSHIHRTPSELQLADDMRRAEYEDVRMYARLVVGMQSQCLATGYVHPLTKKSLQDILKTKQADEDELEKNHQDEDGFGWELDYVEERDENSVDTPLPCHPMGTSARAPTLVKTPSEGSLISNLSNAPAESGQDEQDHQDECVFSLEL